ncbi:Hypothetical predicted protein [Octopus vulgaris]|uniref:Uncharacterized protein n=1 Tax=Octopus vulgaris TaxID=6645 RepID=A0AA36F9W5_OCTVU|nr:Hypothetical predicted protein [Octopus vulgaris]
MEQFHRSQTSEKTFSFSPTPTKEADGNGRNKMFYFRSNTTNKVLSVLVSFHNLEEKDSVQLLATGVDSLLDISYAQLDASRPEYALQQAQTTKLTAYFDKNPEDAEARSILYCDFSEHCTSKFLNSVSISRLTPNTIKIETPVMLLQNTDHTQGHWNGTPFTVLNSTDALLTLRELSGVDTGAVLTVSKILLQPSDTDLPFTL